MMRSLRRMALALAAAGALAGCAHQERLSPCACDWRPLTGQPSGAAETAQAA